MTEMKHGVDESFNGQSLNILRAAVLGANDGMIISIVGVVIGVGQCHTKHSDHFPFHYRRFGRCFLDGGR